MVPTWRSIQKFAELEPLAGMLTEGSVPATPNSPWGMLKGAFSEPDWSLKAVSGPLVMPAL